MKARLSFLSMFVRSVLLVGRLMLLGLPVLLLLGLLMLVTPVFADGGTIPAVPNILNMTLSDFLLWIVSDAVLGVVVALLLIQFNVPEVARPILMTAALGAASWLVRTLVPFIPPEFLTKTLWEIVFILLGMVPAWLGLRLAALQHVGMLRAAYVSSLPAEDPAHRRLQRAVALAGVN